MDNTNPQADTNLSMPVVDPVMSQPLQATVITTETPMTTHEQTQQVTQTATWQEDSPVQSTSPWQTTPVTTIPQADTVMQAPWQTVQTSEVTPPLPYVSPVDTSVAPNTPTPLTTIVTSPKKGMSPVVMAIAVMFLAAGAIGGTYIVSRGINTSAPIAPNAPASVPKAFDPTEEMPIEIVDSPVGGFDPNGTIDCTNVPGTAPYGNRCVATIVTESGDVVWAPGAIEALQ